MTLDVAVAFVVFNRPESTRKSFQRIRAAQPNRLFLISDGPRTNRAAEFALVEQSRRIAEQVDWSCEVEKIYSDQNMGCGTRISSGISEAMKQVDRLIVLEDDCVAEDSFFPFCDELLERYEDDQRVMAISGNNFQMGTRRTAESYYFSKYPHCWGWATWRRAWDHFQLGIPAWPEFRDALNLATLCTSRREIEYWTMIFDKVHAGQTSSWAYPWTLCCWMNHGLTVLPEVNLVTNTGFGDDATHTSKRGHKLSNLSTGRIETIQHPSRVSRHFVADQFTDDLVFSGTYRRRGPLRRLGRRLRGKAA